MSTSLNFVPCCLTFLLLVTALEGLVHQWHMDQAWEHLVGGISDGKSGLSRGPASLLAMGLQGPAQRFAIRTGEPGGHSHSRQHGGEEDHRAGSGFPSVCAVAGRPLGVFSFWASVSSSAQLSVNNLPVSFSPRFSVMMAVKAMRWGEGAQVGIGAWGQAYPHHWLAHHWHFFLLLGRLHITLRWMTQLSLTKEAALHVPTRRTAPTSPSPPVGSPWLEAVWPSSLSPSSALVTNTSSSSVTMKCLFFPYRLRLCPRLPIPWPTLLLRLKTCYFLKTLRPALGSKRTMLITS